MQITQKQDYILFARARGVPERRIFMRHAFCNAALPVYTHVMLGLGALVGGALVIETVFTYPRLGSLIVMGVNARDYPLLQGLFIFTSVSVILACAPFEKPSSAPLFGCDDVEHDLFSQVLYGGRVSLLVGLLVATLSTAIAASLAVLVGVYGGWVDRLLMRIVDVVLAMPFTPLVIVLGVYFGALIQTQIFMIEAVMWASPLRELRAQILAMRNAGYVEASRAMGAGAWFIGLKHLLPELAPLIVPQFIRIAHAAILVETSLAFLGLGDPLQDSWGTVLFHANALAAFLTGAWVY